MMKRTAISSPKTVSVNLYPVVMDLSHLDGATTTTMSTMQYATTTSTDLLPSRKEADSDVAVVSLKKQKNGILKRQALAQKSEPKTTSSKDTVRANALKLRLQEKQKDLANLEELPQLSTHRRYVSATDATTNSSSNRCKTMIPKIHHDHGMFSKTHRRAFSEGTPSSFVLDTKAKSSAERQLTRFQDDYVLTRQIFQSKQSDIFECIHRKTGLRHCVKIFNQKSYEVEFLKLAQGSFGVVNLVEIIEETVTGKTFVVMELLDEINLLSRVMQNDGFDEATVKKIAWELLQGIQHLHQLGITHNNLHPSNLLTMDDDDAVDTFHVKIADFGHASHEGSVNNSKINSRHLARATSVRSKNIFHAPENLTSQASDMWSVGALLCFCITGGEILQEKSHQRLVQKLQSEMGKSNKKYAALSRCGKQFLCGLLHTDPTVRFTVSEALEHMWFADFKHPTQTTEYNTKHFLQNVRSDLSSEPLPQSRTFTRSVTKIVQQLSYRRS